jgi:hypothetical protein
MPKNSSIGDLLVAEAQKWGVIAPKKGPLGQPWMNTSGSGSKCG